MNVRIAIVALIAFAAFQASEGRVGAQDEARPAFDRLRNPDSVFREGQAGGEDILIETDRDSFTPATTLAPERRVIFESALSFINNREHRPDTYSFPEVIARYGLNDWIELRLGWNYEIGGGDVDVSAVQGGAELEEPGASHESRIEYGVKIEVSKQDRLVPRTALIAQGYTPTHGTAKATQMSSTYVAGWELPGGSNLDTAIRFATACEDTDIYKIWAPSIVWKVPVHDRWSVHGEYFGLFSYDRNRDFSQSYFSPGLHYLITPNWEVGFRVGWGLNAQSAPFFSNLGAGYRY
jgi:hypothetical protein